MFSITADRTGFPLVHVASLGVDVHLLPITKLQFEAFLAEPNEFEDSLYEDVLRANERCSWRRFDQGKREKLFLTGILPKESEEFARWLGCGFQLPSVSQWQTIYSHWMQAELGSDIIEAFLEQADEQTSGVIKALLSGRNANSMVERAHMRGGVLEWVTSRRGPRLLGEPRDTFCRQLFDWRTPITPTDPSKRNNLCGFRLVKPAGATTPSLT